MYDDNNIFAKIIRSEIPCDKVYEDDNVLFFYDINPVAKVHVLGIPKIKCANFADFIEQTNEQTIKNFFNKILDVIKTFKRSIQRLEFLIEETREKSDQLIFSKKKNQKKFREFISILLTRTKEPGISLAR